MTEAPPPVPDWMLERYALGELPPDQSAAIRARLQAEAEAVRAGLTPKGDLSARLEALQASDAAILEAHPPRQAAAEIRRRIHLRQAEDREPKRSPTGQRRWVIGVLGPLAAAALALVVVLPMLGPERPLEDNPETIITTAKGFEPRLLVYRQTGRLEGEPMKEGDRARAGEMVQLAYIAGGSEHGVIVSIDGRGGVTLHHPAEPGGSTQLSVDGERKLSFAGELDDAPGFERYFMVTSAQPIDVQAVLDAASRLAASGAAAERELPLPPQLEQQSLRIDKEDAP
jgi:hypothetical protein